MTFNQPSAAISHIAAGFIITSSIRSDYADMGATVGMPTRRQAILACPCERCVAKLPCRRSMMAKACVADSSSGQIADSTPPGAMMIHASCLGTWCCPARSSASSSALPASSASSVASWFTSRSPHVLERGLSGSTCKGAYAANYARDVNQAVMAMMIP